MKDFAIRAQNFRLQLKPRFARRARGARLWLLERSDGGRVGELRVEHRERGSFAAAQRRVRRRRRARSNDARARRHNELVGRNASHRWQRTSGRRERRCNVASQRKQLQKRLIGERRRAVAESRQAARVVQRVRAKAAHSVDAGCAQCGAHAAIA